MAEAMIPSAPASLTAATNGGVDRSIIVPPRMGCSVPISSVSGVSNISPPWCNLRHTNGNAGPGIHSKPRLVAGATRHNLYPLYENSSHVHCGPPGARTRHLGIKSPLLFPMS